MDYINGSMMGNMNPMVYIVTKENTLPGTNLVEKDSSYFNAYYDIFINIVYLTIVVVTLGIYVQMLIQDWLQVRKNAKAKAEFQES
jgi:hypothetical protein